MNRSMPGLPVHHQLPELLKLMSIESVMPSNHLILCRPLPLPLSIFPSIRVLSNESLLRNSGPGSGETRKKKKTPAMLLSQETSPPACPCGPFSSLTRLPAALQSLTPPTPSSLINPPRKRLSKNKRPSACLLWSHPGRTRNMDTWGLC